MLDHEKYMRMALKEAVKAYQQGEIPIGAVLVNDEDGQVIATGFNLRDYGCNSSRRNGGHSQGLSGSPSLAP